MRSALVHRTGVNLHPDRTRVLLRPFLPVEDPRADRICASVLALPETEVCSLLDRVRSEFGERHLGIDRFLRARFEQMRIHVGTQQPLSNERELLLGAYFAHEYSLEAAALFNPSIVPHPDQSGLEPDSLRFVLSLRATGEGHISCVTFRTGVVDRDGGVKIGAPTRYCLEPDQLPSASYERPVFERKLSELGLAGEFSRLLLERLAEVFTLEELRASIEGITSEFRMRDQETEAVARKTLMLAQSNYEVRFAPDSRLSERVLFPTTPSQSNGIEDARFVRFREDDGTECYYATYTAYDGKLILPQFIETPDFLDFKFVTLNGAAVHNKGMALFPRRINGHYAMLGRQDYENIYLMYSDHLHFWDSAELIVAPKFPWEFIQIGNCGSPIETDSGWLVLCHGVGPMRKYCIGAFLLDRHDPTRVLGRLREPLIQPNEREREGYVPNVVYSCGSLLHGKRLIVPYATSDYATTFATVALDDLLAEMTG
jgi:predicted GH43/DUF377 family glycosyl hydrolase